MSLYPKITRPSRITPHCSTLIDNIFTNDIEDNTVSGLLIIDISDHCQSSQFTMVNLKEIRQMKRQHIDS